MNVDPMRCKIGLLGLLMGLSCLQVAGQPLDWSRLKALNMRSIGPAGMSGRVTALTGSNEERPVLWAGTASGGLWRSTNQGDSWQPTFDKEVIMSIGAVAVAPGNPQVVWAGTGEGNPRNSQNSGKGIYRSLDGGRSWQCMGLQQTKTIHRILVDPRDERVVYAAAMGSAWGPNPDRGVFKTTDGGESWNKVLHIDDTTGCADLVMDPSNPNKLIAAMWSYHREPWFFTSGGKGSGLHMTLDGGRTWRRLDDKAGLPAGQLGRIGLAIAPSRPNVVYALVEAKTNALYRSDDGGFSWSKRADANIGNRPFYYAELYVDPSNENRIYNLHTTVTMSEDGGRTFSNLVGWGEAHPDHHAWWVDPRNPDFLVDGNDGGLAISHDRGKGWRFASDLPLGQFYHVNYDMARPYNVMGGLQDNGSWVGPSEVWAFGGIRNHHWREVLFGDGFDMAVYGSDSNWVYCMSQGGALCRTHKETGEVLSIRPVHPEGKSLRFNWNAGMATDPHKPGGIYYGSQFLHYSPDGGMTWSLRSPDLTTNDTTKQKQGRSGGLTLDATAAENYTTIVTIAPSPLDRDMVWVGTDDGRLQLTRDGGKTWQDHAGKLPGLPKGAYIAQVVASGLQAGEAFVVANDYRRNNWSAMAFHTRDHGQTWRRIVDDKQVAGHCLSIAQDIRAERLLYLGTDQGLYISVDAGENWTRYDRNFPAVPVSDLRVHPREGDLIVATYGRALWILDSPEPLRILSKQGASFTEKEFAMLPIDDALALDYRSFEGERFPGVGEFEGAGSQRGATIMLWLRPPGTGSDSKAKPTDKKEEGKAAKGKPNADEKGATERPASNEGGTKPEEKKGDIKLWVLETNGDTLRHLTVTPDTGFQRVMWRLECDGVHWPQYQKPRNDYPGGWRVEPGTYKVVAQYGKQRDSSMVKVLADPRKWLDPQTSRARKEAMARYRGAAQSGSKAFDQLREARASLDRLDKLLDNMADVPRDSLRKLQKPLRDTIKGLMEVYLDPEDMKGLEHFTVQLGDQYELASGYLEPLQVPSPNGLLALARFEAEVERVRSRIQRFIDVDWQGYRRKVEGAGVPLLKELRIGN